MYIRDSASPLFKKSIFKETGLEIDSFYDDIEKANLRISKYLHHTEILTTETLDAELGFELYFKAENMQKSGSFKARGATNAVLASMIKNQQSFHYYIELLTKIK